jgi:hypothetical protein
VPTPDPATARTRRPTRQPRPLTLPECARIAAHLHPAHQVVLWLQRIMGLRISEAFGVLLGDVIELGDTALLAAHPEIAPLVKVAAILDDKVTASIGTLLTPTTRKVAWGKHNPLRDR